jgi:glucose-6-phosphate dehydrogenase assembly protein OpcA
VEAAVTSGVVSDVVARVEKELASFWNTPDTSTGKEVAKVRASTMNYAVAAAPSEIERLREELQALAEVRAGRVFLLSVDPRREPWDVDAEVVATCKKDGDDVVCHDRIELVFGAMAAGRAGSVVSALALSEVPTIFEVGRAAPAPLVDAFAKSADRFVVDSAHTSAEKVASIAQRSEAPIGDRAMVRSYQWRDLVARFFDASPWAARAIRRVTVQHTPGAPQPPEALLFGWLASRLGWTFESRSVARDREGGAVALAIGESPREGLGAGEIVGVEISAEKDGKEIQGRCTRTGDPRVASWSLRGEENSDHTHGLGRRDEVWVLLKSLDASDADKVTRATLAAAAAWSAK